MKKNRRRGKSISSGDTIALAGMVITLTGGVSTIFFYLIFMPTLKEPESENYRALRNRLAGHSQREEVYRASLTRFLRWADRFFEGPEEEPGLPDPENLTLRDRFWQRVFFRKYADVPQPEPRAKSWQPNPWSAAAYDRCLLIAVFYPLFAALFSWIVFGTGGELARTIGFADVSNELYRFVFFIFVIAALACITKLLSGEIRWYDWMAIMVVIGIGIMARGILHHFFPQVEIKFTLVFVFAVATTIAGMAVFDGIAARTGTGTGTVALAITFGSALGLGDLIYGTVGFALPIAAVYAFSVVFIVAIATELNRLGPFLLVLLIVLIIAFGCLLFYAGRPNESVLSFSILIAIGILPLVNAPFDWASTGLTRYLLRRNVTEEQFAKRAFWSCLDFVGALLLLVLLCAAMVVALELANGTAQSGGFSGTLVDVQTLLTDIRDHSGESRHYWLYFAVLSTIIPTFLHLAIWVASTATFQSERLSTWAVPLLDSNFAKGSADRNKLGMALTAQVMAAGAVSLTLLFVILWLLASLFGLGTYLIDMLLWLSGVCQGWFA